MEGLERLLRVPRTPQETSTRRVPMATAPRGLDEEGREAARLNALLKTYGYTEAAITLWWNEVRYPELGNRTATQAWLTGEEADRDAVKRLVETVTVEGQEW